MTDQAPNEGDGAVSMKIFVGTLAGGTFLIFLGQIIPEKLTGIVSVIGAVIVAGGLLWLTARRINIRAHGGEGPQKR